MNRKCILVFSILCTLLLAPAWTSAQAGCYDVKQLDNSTSAAPILKGMAPLKTLPVDAEGLRVKAEKFTVPEMGNIWRYSYEGKIFAYLIHFYKIGRPARVLYKEKAGDNMYAVKVGGTYLLVPEWCDQ